MAETYDESHIQDLIAHVTERGGKVSEKIKFVHNEESGTGIFAACAIASRAVLVTVPFSECISTESVMATRISEIVNIRQGLLEYPDEVIALGLMYAATRDSDGQDSSPWMKHVKTLPKTYNTPLYWTEEELNEIKGHNVFHLTNLMKRQIQADWESLHQPLTEAYPDMLGDATIELYQWALSTVYSRAVGIHRNGVYTRCIPPIVDMANHNPDAGSEAAETLSYDEVNETVSFINNTTKSAGDECFAVYGRYPNEKLLFTYGFVIPHSPIIAVDLWTRVTPSLSLAAEKQAILSGHELTREPTYDFEGTLRPGFVSSALLATIRIVQADAAELECAEAAFRGEMLSVRNETASYVSLRNLLLSGMQVNTAEVGSTTHNMLHFYLTCTIYHLFAIFSLLPLLSSHCTASMLMFRPTRKSSAACS
jgi:hypothetical protein